MRVLIVYGTTEGHTRTLSHFAARALGEAGRPTAVEPAGHETRHPDPSPYDAVILAGSLYVGRFQAPLAAYASAWKAVLNTKPSAFISVSLCAAGLNPHDWDSVEDCFARFQQETQWTPTAVHHAAGAVRDSEHDFFKRLALRFIAAQRGEAPTSRDQDLTDYAALRGFLIDFAGGAAVRA